MSCLAVVIANVANSAGQCSFAEESGARLSSDLQGLILVAFSITLLSQDASIAWKFSSSSGVLDIVQNRAMFRLLSGLLLAIFLCLVSSLEDGLCLSDDVIMSICGAVYACTIHVLTEIMWAPARMNGSYTRTIGVNGYSRPDSGTEIVQMSALNFQTASLVCFTLPAVLGSFVDIRVKAAFSFLSMAVSVFTILAWCTTWWRTCSPLCVPNWVNQCFQDYRWCLKRGIGHHFQLRYRSIETTVEGRKLLEQEFKATSLSLAFGALALCASASVVAAESGLCSILTSLEFDFSEEPVAGSAWTGPRLSEAMANCGADWGLGMSSPLPRITHIIIAFGVFVQIAVQSLAAWSRVVLREALESQNKQRAQSQAMLRWLSHECRSPAAAALLTLDVLIEEVFPQLKTKLAEGSLKKRAESSCSTGSASASGAHTHAHSPRLPAIGTPHIHANSGSVSHAPSQGESSSLTGHRKHGEGVHELVREAGSMLKMVAQPLHSLSGVLDNMLLFMQQQQGVTTDRSSAPLPLASNWRAAWSQASALQALESKRTADAKVSYVVPYWCTASARSVQGLVPGEGAAAVQMRSSENSDALQMMHSHDIRSCVTNATVQQVMSNLTSNAFKYGPDKQGVLDLKVQFGLATSRPEIEFLLARGTFGEQIEQPNRQWDPEASEEISRKLESTVAAAQLQLEHERVKGPPCFLTDAVACVLTVCVRDSGQGMSACEAASLFRPFTRLRRRQAARGTGLGLWLMRQLLQSQGGTLEVKSEGVGLGCVFIAAMPAVFVPKQEGGAETQPLSLRHLDSFDHEPYVDSNDNLTG